MKIAVLLLLGLVSISEAVKIANEDVDAEAYDESNLMENEEDVDNEAYDKSNLMENEDFPKTFIKGEPKVTIQDDYKHTEEMDVFEDASIELKEYEDDENDQDSRFVQTKDVINEIMDEQQLAELPQDLKVEFAQSMPKTIEDEFVAVDEDTKCVWTDVTKPKSTVKDETKYLRTGYKYVKSGACRVFKKPSRPWPYGLRCWQIRAWFKARPGSWEKYKATWRSAWENQKYYVTDPFNKAACDKVGGRRSNIIRISNRSITKKADYYVKQ